jgi:hypothetical protein
VALVAAGGVVVIDVPVPDGAQVPLAGDEHPVGALAAYRGDPPFGVGVHLWCLRCGEHDVDADRGEYRVEGGGELRVAVADYVCESVSALFKVGG